MGTGRGTAAQMCGEAGLGGGMGNLRSNVRLHLRAKGAKQHANHKEHARPSSGYAQQSPTPGHDRSRDCSSAAGLQIHVQDGDNNRGLCGALLHSNLTGPLE